MLIRRAPAIVSSEVTDERVYRRRREFMAAAGGALVALAARAVPIGGAQAQPARASRFPDVKPGPFGTDEVPTPYEDVTSYTNFYEFGADKASPARSAGRLRTRPWTVKVDGEVGKPGNYHVDDLIRPNRLEERVYRMRCVEGWSMVIPWVGFPLADVLKRFQPTPRAKYVELTTLFDREQMPGQRSPVLDWPYVEGLRLDEAMHPLTILAVGLYGSVLPSQNGAPLRLVVPWKYGFKSVKSIVRIRLLTREPRTSWPDANPQEYGFYANVNPAVDHPRWSQATERRIGEDRRRKTLMFNGYADEVAGLYRGMDLKRQY